MTRTYTTVSGDMWDKIAYEQMGSVMHTDRLIKANAGHAAVFVFPAGIVLDIPETEKKTDMMMPPWKRGFLI